MLRRVERDAAVTSLMEAAADQGGYVTAPQAERLGLARDDVARLVRSGDLRRVRRGVFGMRHAENRWEDAIAAWLHLERSILPWERQTPLGALSHDTAAAFHNLGTIIPGLPTLTLPPDARRVPEAADIEVHRAPLADADWTWLDAGGVDVPVTTPARTIVDLILARHERSYLIRAVNEALHRKLMTPDELSETAVRRRQRSASLRADVAALLPTA